MHLPHVSYKCIYYIYININIKPGLHMYVYTIPNTNQHFFPLYHIPKSTISYIFA